MSEGVGLNSLLKYRFVKRSSNKLNHGDSSDSSTSNDSISTQPNGASGDNKQSVFSNSNEPQSEDSCSTSPIFKKFVRPSQPVAGDTSSSSSPWLSKAQGSTLELNGEHVKQTEGKKKFRRLRAHRSSDSDSDADGETSRSGKLSQGESSRNPKITEWEHNLRVIFPTTNTIQIRAAVAAAMRADNLEAGVDYLISVHTLKRKVDNLDEEPSRGGNSISRKRIRMMSSTDSEDSQNTEASTFQSQNDSQKTEIYSFSQSEEQSIQFLKDAFPSLSQKRLLQVLQDCNWQTEQAVAVLSSDAANAGTESETTPSARSSNPDLKTSEELSDVDENFEENEDSDESSDEDEDRVLTKKDIILSFFEEATVAELAVLPGCSRKKADVIVELRPFQTWENLVEKFTTTKLLSYALIGGCSEIIQLRNVVVRLMKQCEQISCQMELVVSKLTGKLNGTQDEDDQITVQPKLLTVENELKPYQLIGLNWLRLMHSQHLNGILADEMGLGKTIQAIAFLAHLLEEGEEGPHVIIVPSSTIENWLRELSSWCPALRVIVYYGSQEERRATRHSLMYEGNEDFNILLTTYNMATGGVEDRTLFKKFQFHYAVFDEGHMLKNMSSLRFQNLMKISAERRLLLTGTPLQNNLLELISLLCFVMPDIFQGKTEPLKKMFSMISRSDNEQGKYEKERIAQAQRIMKPFVLRRLKKDVLTQLPLKEEMIEYCPLLPEQQELYNSLVQKFSVEMENGEPEGGGMAMFMQLRKAANHPLLLRKHYTDTRLKAMAEKLSREPSHRERGALPKLIMEDMAVMNDFELIRLCQQYKKHIGKFELPASLIGESAKFRELDKLFVTMQQENDRVLLFSQFTMMLDVVEIFLKQKSIRYLRLDGSTPVTERQQLIDQFNENADIFIFLLSTRAGGLGINLTAANVIILHDIDFNPYNDKQAEDRCHRLGQKRTVRIIRLIAKGTVEECMLRCAQAKLRLEQDVTAAEESNDSIVDVAVLLHEAIGKAQANKKMQSGSSSTSTKSPASDSTS